VEKAKVFELTGDKSIIEEVYINGKTIGRRLYKPDGTLHSDKNVEIGVETDTTSLDDRPIKVKLTVVNDNKVIREEKGANYSVTITSEVSGNNMTQVRAKSCKDWFMLGYRFVDLAIGSPVKIALQ
jgi:hypothetical protein